MSQTPDPGPLLSMVGMIVIGFGIGFILFGSLRAGLIEEVVLMTIAPVQLVAASVFILGFIAFAYYQRN